MRLRKLIGNSRLAQLSLLMLLLAACAQAARPSTGSSVRRISCGQEWQPSGLPAYPAGPVRAEAESDQAWAHELERYAKAQQMWAAVVVPRYLAAQTHAAGVNACVRRYNDALIIRLQD